ncbi:MAG: hypothetical protein ACO3EZ_08870 [Prochlorotrichaceae cyanobacterium]
MTTQLVQHPVDREDFSDYVANLQLHMSLQARNLLPGIAPKSVGDDTRAQLLQETQAAFEKLASRQR